MTVAEHHNDPTSNELMFDALRDLEHEMHEVAPGIIKRGLRDISNAGVDKCSERFMHAIRACFHEELALVMAELRAELRGAR
jgi:hypothetical protein